MPDDLDPGEIYDGIPVDDDAEPDDAGLGEHEGPGTVHDLEERDR